MAALPRAAAAAAAAAICPGWQRCISLLHRCSTERKLHAVHALFLTYGLHRHTIGVSRLIFAACSLPSGGGLLHASLILHHSPASPNSFIYNSLIHAHARGPDPLRALHYFRLMLRSPDPFAAPDHHSFPFALAACVAIPSLPSGIQIHAVILKNGLASADHFVQTAALRLYAQRHDDLSHARKLFEEISQTDVVHFDVLMNGYLRRGIASETLRLFRDMLVSGVPPDKHVITTAITACSHDGSLKQGIWIHMYLVEQHHGFLEDTYICSALINMYAKCGSIEEAGRVFDAVPERNSFTWAAMVGGFAVHGFAEDAIRCLSRMQDEDGLPPDGIVILSVMAACARSGAVDEGLKLLAEMKANYGVVPEHEHYSCAVDMLCRVGRLADAVELIRRMPMRPLASVWGSVLAGCRLHNNVELAELAVAELQSMTACSVIEVDGVISSFVAGDPVHPRLLEIWWILNVFRDHADEECVFEAGDCQSHGQDGAFLILFLSGQVGETGELKVDPEFHQFVTVFWSPPGIQCPGKDLCDGFSTKFFTK